MLRAGEGIAIQFDGAQAEISLTRPEWFVAEITGTVANSDPVKHKWVKQQLNAGGVYEDSNPKVEGNGTNSPAFLPDGGTQANGLVFMRQRGVNGSGQVEYEIITGGPATTPLPGGVSEIEVVTGITCGANGISVTTATLASDAVTTIIMKQFLGLVDVVPKTFAGSGNRQVIVNEAETGLTFGPILNKADVVQDFLGLSDTPNTFSGQNSKLVGVNGTGSALVFTTLATGGSITGGSISAMTMTTIQLDGDHASPAVNNYYGTHPTTGARGWHDRQITTTQAAIANAAIGASINDTDLASLGADTLTKLTILQTKINAILAVLRTHKLINP